MRELRPKYAIPFASMVAFLHPESRQCNIYAVRPPEVAAAAAAADVGATTRTVLMVPGDTWSSESGFALKPNDYYEQQDQWIERLAQTADPKIRQEEADERAMTLTFQAFERHFGGFLRSLPPLIWLRAQAADGLHVPSDAAAVLGPRFRARRFDGSRAARRTPASSASARRSSPTPSRKNVVAFVHISMRIRIELAPGGVQTDFLFWGLLSLRELGYFPLRKMLTRRAIRVLWRRRAEVWGFARSLLSPRSFDQKVMGTLMSRRYGTTTLARALNQPRTDRKPRYRAGKSSRRVPSARCACRRPACRCSTSVS